MCGNCARCKSLSQCTPKTIQPEMSKFELSEGWVANHDLFRDWNLYRRESLRVLHSANWPEHLPPQKVLINGYNCFFVISFAWRCEPATWHCHTMNCQPSHLNSGTKKEVGAWADPLRLQTKAGLVRSPLCRNGNDEDMYNSNE